MGRGGRASCGALHGGGIVGGDGAAFGEQHLDQVDGGRFADVVGLALEGEAEDAEALAAQGPEGGANLGEEALLLLDVDLLDFGEQVEVDAELLGDRAEGGDVLGKAGAAVADAGAEEARADAAVQADAAATCSMLASVASQRLETALMKEIFRARKALEACLMISALLVEVSSSGGGRATLQGPGMASRPGVVVASGERRVDAVEHGGGALAVGADDDAVGMQEVGDGGAFAEKLGVGDDVEEVAGDAVALDGAANPLVGVDGDGAFFDDDFVAGERAGDLAGDGFDVREVGVAGLALRRADGDEDGVALAGGLGQVGHEAELPCCDSARAARAGGARG